MKRRAAFWFLALVAGALLALPNALQFEVSPPAPRMMTAACFAFAALVLSLLRVLKLRVAKPEDGAFCGLSFFVGALLSYSLVRQQIVLVVWIALWAFPGAFMGEALGRFWCGESTAHENQAEENQGIGEAGTSCAL